MNKTDVQTAMRVSRNTIIGNLMLFAFKLVAGIAGHSAAMISDAVHSLSDVLSTIVIIIGVRMANKKADKNHPYGHERFESVAAIILTGILFATGLGIGYAGIITILAGNYDAIIVPGTVALVAAVTSIIVKEAMYWYTRAAAKKINSDAIMADAWHHRSDALSSIGSFIGIFGAQMGYPVLDSVASLVICIFILKVSIDIFREAVSKMTDRSCDDETIKLIREIVLAQNHVLGVDKLKTRLFGNKIYVDVEINIDRFVPLHVSHDIAHKVHNAVENGIPNVKHCMVHVNPSELIK